MSIFSTLRIHNVLIVQTASVISKSFPVAATLSYFIDNNLKSLKQIFTL
jgi:hypothetical protein